MIKKVIISCIIMFMFFDILFNTFVYAERYDTGDKVIYTDKYGRATQIIDKSTFSKASENVLIIENVSIIVFVICLIVAIIMFNYIDKNEEHSKILEYALGVICVIGIIALVISMFVYCASGGWAAH